MPLNKNLQGGRIEVDKFWLHRSKIEPRQSNTIASDAGTIADRLVRGRRGAPIQAEESRRTVWESVGPRHCGVASGDNLQESGKK